MSQAFERTCLSVSLQLSGISVHIESSPLTHFNREKGSNGLPSKVQLGICEVDILSSDTAPKKPFK